MALSLTDILRRVKENIDRQTGVGLQIPSYGEGPVDSTAGSAEQLRADYLRSLRDQAFAEQRLRESQQTAAEQERQRLIAERQAKIDTATAIAQQKVREAILRGPQKVIEKLQQPIRAAKVKGEVTSALAAERSGAIASVTRQTGRNPLFTVAEAQVPGIGVRPTQVTADIKSQIADIRNVSEAKAYFEKAFTPQIKVGSEEAQNVFKETIKRYAGVDMVDIQKPREFTPTGEALKILPTNLKPYDYKAVASRAYEIPVTVGSRGIGDIPFYRGQTLETIYKQLIGSDLVPDYSMRVWNGPAADAIRAAEALNRKVGLDRQRAEDAGRLPSAQVEEQSLAQAKEYIDLADTMQQLQDQGLNPLDNPELRTAYSRIQRTAYLGQQQLDKAYSAMQTFEEKRRKEEQKQKSGVNGWIERNIQTFSENWDWIRWIPNPAFGFIPTQVVLTALSAPLDTVFTVPYYSYRNARMNGYSKGDAALIGLGSFSSGMSLLSAIGIDVSNIPDVRGIFEMPKNMNEIIGQVGTSEAREKLKEKQRAMGRPELKSFGEDVTYSLTGRYDASILTDPQLGFIFGPQAGVSAYAISALHNSGIVKSVPVFGDDIYKFENWALGRSWSGPIDLVASFVFDPLTYTPFIAAKGSEPLAKVGQVAAKQAEKAAVRQGEKRVAAELAEGTFDYAAADSGRLSSFIRFVTRRNNITEVGAEAASAARRQLIVEGTNPHIEGWFNSAKEVISKFGSDIINLKKALPDLAEDTLIKIAKAVEDFNSLSRLRTAINEGVDEALQVSDDILKAVVEAGSKGGATEAGFKMLQELAAEGQVPVKINLRRQFLGFVDNLTLNRGVMGPNGRQANRLVGGRAVPVYLGRSSVKPRIGTFASKLEKWAGRISQYGHIVGNNFSDKLDYVANVLTKSQGFNVGDWYAQKFPDYALGNEDFELRFDDLLEIVADYEDEIPGIQRFLLEARDATVSNPDADKVLRNAEIVTHLAISDDKEVADVARELVARLAHSTYKSDDEVAEALKTIAMRTGRKSPRRKALAEWIVPGQEGSAKPFVYDEVANAEARIDKETNRLISVLADMDGKLSAVEASRIRLGTMYDSLTDSLRMLLVGRGISQRAWEQEDSNIVRAIESMRDGFNKSREILNRKLSDVNGEIAFYDLKNTARGGLEVDDVEKYNALLQRRSEIENQISAVNALEKEAIDAAELRRTTVRKQFRETLDSTSTYLEDILVARIKRMGELIDSLPSEADIAAADLEERTAWRKILFGEGDEKITDPIERYALVYQEVHGLEPNQFDDLFIRDVVLAVKQPEQIIHSQLTPVEQQIADFAIGTVQQSQRALEGTAPIIGPVKPTLKGEKGFGLRQLYARIAGLPPAIQEYMRNKIGYLLIADEQIAEDGLTRIAKDVELLIAHRGLSEKVAEEIAKSSSLGQYISALNAAEKRGTRGLKTISKLALSVQEAVPPRVINWAYSSNEGMNTVRRLEDFERIAQSYGFDAGTRAQLRRRILEMRSQYEMYDLISEMQQAWAIANGVPFDILTKKQTEIWRKRITAFQAANPEFVTNLLGVDKLENADILRGVAMLSQLSNQIYVLSAEDATLELYRYLYKNDPSAARRLLNGVRALPSAASQGALGKFAKGTHGLWKASVVTNLPNIAIGAIGGFVFGDPRDPDTPDFWERLKFAGVGGVIGAASGVRYIARVAGIEERLIRYSLSRGFFPTEWIPGIAKLWAEHGVELPARNLDDLVGSVKYPTKHLEYNRVIAGVSDEWIPVDQSNIHFIDAWHRIINRQVNPSKNILDRIVLEWWGRPGAGKNAWRKQAQDWLESPAGNRELKSLLGSYGGPKDMDELLNRLDAFFKSYLDNYELRQMLLSGVEVDRKFLKELVDMNQAPEVVHIIKSWVIPTSLSEVWNQFKQVSSRLILELPTTKMNRVPMARSIYGSEYRQLRRGGVVPEIARELAEQRATRLTNKVMFQLADESRFAAKADFFFPFQQPREELVRVYAGLVSSNWSRTLQLTRLGATAFNNGSQSGLFFENSNGEWVMRIPGSAWLSRVVGGPQEGYTLTLKNLFFLLQGNAFASNYSSTDFFASGPLSLVAGTLPSPGGPWWILATNAAYKIWPESFDKLQDEYPIVYNRLYPYGRGNNLLGPQSLRMFETFWGQNTPPWDFLTKDQQEGSLNNLRNQVISELLYQHKDDPNYVEYLQSDEGQDEIYRNLGALLLSWSAVQAVTPAPAKPIMPGKNEYDALTKEYEKLFGKENVYQKVLELRPDMAPFMQRKTVDVVDDYDDWLNSYGYRATDIVRGKSRYLTSEEFLDQFKQARDRNAAYKEYQLAWDGYYTNPAERFAEIERVKKKWESSGIDFSNEYFMRRELARIVFEVPEKDQTSELDVWRRDFKVSPEKYASMLKELRNFRIDPYQNARDYEDIYDLVQYRTTRGGMTVEDVVSSLSPAEQVKYWQYAMASINYVDRKFGESEFAVGKRATEATAQWKTYKSLLSQVYAKYPFLGGDRVVKPETVLTQARNALLLKNQDVIDALSEQIGTIYDAMAIAAESGDWTTWRALKNQRDDLSSQKLVILKELYKKYPDMVQYQEDFKTLVFLMENQDSKSAQDSLRILNDRYAKLGIPYLVFDSEERNYLRMSTEMRKNYNTSLTYRLNLSQGQIGKLYWEFLTPFQQDLLQKAGLPDTAIEKWKGEQYGTGQRRSSIQNELSYAYELMSQANKRPKGAKAPAAYDEYKLIPVSNSAARSRFLKDHPEVAEWIKLGPFANMSEIDRLIVTNILVKSGKWEGDVMDDTEITNLAWAREQLKTWSRRTTPRPENYDIWLNMPTGPEKAAYLEQHPEVQQWIAAGPMVNMPEAYKEVVRDIMIRYGEWSASTDPLGEIISGFYATPASRRQKYLDDHPELKSYWKAIRTPEEQRMADLTERYFSFPDGTARKIFLNAYPELQQYFVDSRIKRYENFLAKVAQYMGANPEVFTNYLDKQQALLSELIGRFGSPSLVRERVSAPVGVAEGRGTSGRVRQAPRRRQ